jgi:hypothetical protein
MAEHASSIEGLVPHDIDHPLDDIWRRTGA